MSAVAANQNLWRLALPLLLNSMIGMITTLVDTVIISMHSEEAAAAVSLANQILVVAYDLSVLMGVGGTILIARALGRDDRLESRQVARVAIISNTLLGIAIGAVMYFCAPLFARWMNVPDNLLEPTKQYIFIIAFALPFNGFLMASVACLRGYSQAKAILMLGLVAFPSYLILDYVLVLGFAGIPALGVQGSALATLSVRVGSVLVLLFLLPRLIGFNWRLVGFITASRRLLRPLLKLSTPSVLDNVAYGFYQLVLLSLVAGLGVVTLVSRYYTLALSAFLAVLVMAISQANEVLVGYRHGQGYAAMNAMVWRSGCWSAALATLAAILMYGFSEPLIAIFSTDPSVVRLTQELLLLTIFIQPLTGLNTVLFHSLRVLGDVRVPVLFSQLVMWGMAVPLAYWFTQWHGLGVLGLWYAMIAEESAKTLFMIYRWRQQDPLRK